MSCATEFRLVSIPETKDSTDFRQFEYYLNVTGLDVSGFALLLLKRTDISFRWQSLVIATSTICGRYVRGVYASLSLPSQYFLLRIS